ncbi:hypothetical protein GPJ56_000623 [Histomonas meleagridis]|uniref:uncharacterized protein n=1 Tax=Histomonas meleagridis TaxID=135588 RepID=UPI00355AA350|nr:hypothetical protein GPJ56_000623 [Histomonas meleagridis]KAH0804750.1 hypothetical protein GO595_002444 [Histomonas meleagridis]
MFFLCYLYLMNCDEVIASLTNSYARIDFNSSGKHRILDLETNFVYGSGAMAYLKTVPTKAAQVVSVTSDNVQINASTSDNYIIFKVSAKSTHFCFEILKTSVTSDTRFLFPYFVTSFPNGTSSSSSGVHMNNDYGIGLHTLNGTPTTVASVTSYINWAFLNGELRDEPKCVVTVGKAPIFRSLLQQMVISEGFPTSPHGGPFALDSSRASESYVFASVSEANVDQWINMTLKYGIGMIHFSAAYQTLGHYEPSKSLFPNGTAGVKAVIDKIHAAGLLVGLHTLSGAIDQRDSYLTPIPDSRLAKDYVYKLSKSISSTDTTIYTTTAPEKTFDTVFTYSGKGNVIRIGNELIQYGGLLTQSPYGFSNCVRGAFGTTASSHTISEQLAHLHVRYNTFQPELGSTLVTEIAQNIGNLYNLGFDYIYHDGIEGMPNTSLGTREMRRAMFYAQNTHGSIEASSWDSSSWTFHSRVGALDRPYWGYKNFVDEHIRYNDKNKIYLLPSQMGWWSLNGQSDGCYSQLIDEFEYMCCKTTANDYSASFQGLSPTTKTNGKQDDLMETFKKWETLRRRKILTNEEKEILKKPKEEFHIEGSIDDGIWNIYRAKYPSKILTQKKKSFSIIENPYSKQNLRFRIQPLFSVTPYSNTSSILLASCTSSTEFSIETKTNVTAKVTIEKTIVKESSTSLKIVATNNNYVTEGAWIKMSKSLGTIVDISKRGICCWIYGDGKGEVLNLQPTSPTTYSSSSNEYYVVIDFVGWKYIEIPLIERDAERFDDFEWPYKSASLNRNVYIIGSDFKHIGTMNIYMNNVPANSSCTVYISPIKALPIVTTYLKNAKVEVNGKQIEFYNMSLSSGEYLEFTNVSDCRYFGNRKSGDIQFNAPNKELSLKKGTNNITVEYELEMSTDANPRVKFTVFEYGDVVVWRNPGVYAGIAVCAVIGAAFIAFMIAVLVHRVKNS